MRTRSIRFRITFWYTIALILLVGLTMLTIRLASEIVLRNTIREYLISVVEVNTDEIVYVEKKPATQEAEDAIVYVSCDKGFLRIDDDFLNSVSDVHSAIYTEAGEMLYGENPLAKETEGIAFTESQLWDMRKEGVRYELYDRKLNLELPSGEHVWMRGIVSEEENVAKLRHITRISLMVLPFLILLSVLLGYFLSGRMLRPLRKMEETAEQISKGSDLRQRLDGGEGKDELSRLAGTFNEMIGRLEHSFETEQQFTSDASHELRTPMSVILAQSEYILEKERSAEEYREALEVIQRQGKRMNTLINDMLDYTRMDQSAERYPLSDQDLSAIVSDCAEQMKWLRTKNITLQCDVEAGIRIEGNKLLLTRLVQNLISNAYRYGKQNGRIDVTLKRAAEDGAELCVKDDGIGIAPEEQEKIFERFYRSDASRSEQGTGLGLSMVRRIVELHDARISLESEVGKGSAFHVFFK